MGEAMPTRLQEAEKLLREARRQLERARVNILNVRVLLGDSTSWDFQLGKLEGAVAGVSSAKRLTTGVLHSVQDRERETHAKPAAQGERP